VANKSKLVLRPLSIT